MGRTSSEVNYGRLEERPKRTTSSDSGRVTSSDSKYPTGPSEAFLKKTSSRSSNLGILTIPITSSEHSSESRRSKSSSEHSGSARRRATSSKAKNGPSNVFTKSSSDSDPSESHGSNIPTSPELENLIDAPKSSESRKSTSSVHSGSLRRRTSSKMEYPSGNGPFDVSIKPSSNSEPSESIGSKVLTSSELPASGEAPTRKLSEFSEGSKILTSSEAPISLSPGSPKPSEPLVPSESPSSKKLTSSKSPEVATSPKLDFLNPLITWFQYLCSVIVYYLWPRITDDEHAERRESTPIEETQTVRDPQPAPERKKKKRDSSFDCNSRFLTSSPSSKYSDSNSNSNSESIIAVVPSDSHVIVGIPKLDWKTESIRIKRSRMNSDWMDAEQRDVMRQLDEIIENEEEGQSTSSGFGSTSISTMGSGGMSKRRSRRIESKETPVFVPPPPPPTDAMPHLPRLAELIKSDAGQEFGFNLHAEKGRGHFIGTVDKGGIGERAGLETDQRIVGVNGQLIYPTTGHKEVVGLIKKDHMKTSLLVASVEVDKYHKEHNIPYSWDNVERVDHHHHHHHDHHDDGIVVDTHHHHHEEEEVPAVGKSNGYDVPPVLNPHSIQVNEEREIQKLTTTTKTEQLSTNTVNYQYKESTNVYDAYAVPPATDDDLMAQVFKSVELPQVGNSVTIHSHTEELGGEDASSVSSLTSSHRESAVDVPASHQYVPSYNTQSHEQHSQTHHHHHQHHQQHQQPSPLSNGSSHGYAASSTSGYDDDDIYHLSASEARERLRMKNRKHHLHEMSLNEKYQLVSNM